MKKTMVVSALALTLGLSNVLPVATPGLSPVTVEASAVKQYTVKANVALKAGKHSKQKTLLTIPKGKTVSFVKAHGSWTEVRYAGKTGFVPARDIQMQASSSVSKTSVATSYTTNAIVDLKAGKHSKNKTLVRIPKGKTVTFVKGHGSWSEVKYSGKTGFVATKTLTKKTNTAVAPSPTQTVKTRYANVPLQVKAGRHSSNKTLVTVPVGKTVTVVKDFGSWTQVKYGSTTGYVPTKSLGATPPKATPVSPPTNPTPTPTPAPSVGKMRGANEIYNSVTSLKSPWANQTSMFKLDSRNYGKVMEYFNKDLRISVIEMEFSSDGKQFHSAFYSVKDWMRPTSLPHYQEGVKNALLATDATADAIFGKNTPESNAYKSLLKKEFDLQVAALKKNEEINAVYKPYNKNLNTKIGQTPIEIEIQNETLRVYFN